MFDSKELRTKLDNFNNIILDLRSVEVRVEQEVQEIIPLSSFPKSYENILHIILYRKETLSVGDVKLVLNSKEI